MTTNELRHIFWEWIERFNRVDNREGYFEIYDPKVVLHHYPPGIEGLEGAKQFYRTFWKAFPDCRLSIDEVLFDGDMVACRYTVRGTHLGEFLGAAPTGNRVEFHGQTMVRFTDGKAVERWQALDELGMMRQLGLLPAG